MVRRCPSPDCPPTGRAAGDRWVCAVCVVSVPCVLWCVVPLFPCSSGAPLSGVSVRCCAAVCLPCPLPCARPLLGRWLPLVPFVASLLFTLLPDMHFFPASALLRVSVFFLAGSPCSLVGLSPLNLRRERM